MTEIETFPIPRGHRYFYRDTWGDPRGGGTRTHQGVDIGTSEGTPIVSATRGRVIAVLTDARRPCGLGVVIRSGGELITYCHMRAVPIVHEGETVEPGDLLGHVGSTGSATGPHLHFQVEAIQGRLRRNPLADLQAVDPMRSPVPPSNRSAPRERRRGGGGLLLAALAAFVFMGSKR